MNRYHLNVKIEQLQEELDAKREQLDEMLKQRVALCPHHEVVVTDEHTTSPVRVCNHCGAWHVGHINAFHAKHTQSVKEHKNKVFALRDKRSRHGLSRLEIE